MHKRPRVVVDIADVMARTIWGEARGCGKAGMQRVANVIVNRANHPSWWGRSIVGVCVQPWQFSCRNPQDSNLPKLLAVTKADPQFVIALDLAHAAVLGGLPDLTNGADSFYALSMTTPPSWAANARRTAVDQWHAFYDVEPNAPPGTNPDVRNVAVTADDLNDAELKRITKL